MGLVRAVALNTFREAVRDRVFYNLLLFAVLLVGASLVIGQLAAGQDVKIIKDLGLAASLLFGVGIAVFIGIQLVAREVERRSVHATLSKPVSRPDVPAREVRRVAAHARREHHRDGRRAVRGPGRLWRPDPAGRAGDLDRPGPRSRGCSSPSLLIYVELAVVTAIALLFSTYSSALLSATFTSAIWVAGHFVGDLRTIEQVGASGATAWRAWLVSWVLPNLALFDIKAEVVHGVPVPAGQVLAAVGYGIAYSAAMLSMAVAIFQRRDFK